MTTAQFIKLVDIAPVDILMVTWLQLYLSMGLRRIAHHLANLMTMEFGKPLMSLA